MVEAVPNGRGPGVLYWDPTWTVVTGNGWEKQSLFDCDDKLLPAAHWFNHC
ncbi:glycosyl hydrolase 53 family protein [Streptomyces sp. NPDC048248]|uniref:glycosyl hydrolase 53 family protein n=1 Tax=Streptomyces sp. NPDC048248 TaxID=3365523 RepID=UPI003710B165